MVAIIDLLKQSTAPNSWMYSYYIKARVLMDYIHASSDFIFYFFLYVMVGITVIYLILSLVALFSKKKYEEKPFDPSLSPKVTVQIPTKNEVIALRCAEKCLQFDYPIDKFEVLIGDDSDDPLVSRDIEDFVSKHKNIKVIKRESNEGFKPGNLNNMLKHSTGDIIVIFDSDFVPEKDFLRRIVAPFVHDKEVAAVQARWNFSNFDQNYVTILGSTIVHTFHHIVLSFLKRFDSTSLCGSAEAIRKDVLVELGGWRPGSLTEDIEFSLRLHKSNKRMVYLPDLECYSDVPYTASDLYKQQMRWGYGVISAYKTHMGGLIFNKKITLKRKIISFTAGFGYILPFLMLLLFITGALSLLTHRPAPIDFPKLISETGINILLTSGLIFASIVALYKAKKLKHVFKMLASSFTIGLVTTYYVNKGIIKSILNKPMQWYLLNKEYKYASTEK